MTPKEETSHFGPKPAAEYWQAAPETTLKFEQMQIERKSFLFTLKENPRGRFLRVTENAGGRITNLMIPISGLKAFKKVVDEMVHVSGELPE